MLPKIERSDEDSYPRLEGIYLDWIKRFDELLK